jgi:acyl-CoA synthetase (AMP-forming)/AMP-acid ligase II
MTQSLITRDFINFKFELRGNNNVVTKSQLIDMIRYWKILLWEKYGIRRGSKIGIACLEVDAYHISLIFACSELGCQFVSLDHPVSYETIHKTKAALFAPIDLGISDKTLYQDRLHQHMMEIYCKKTTSLQEFDSYKIVEHSLWSTVADQYFCQEQDPIFLASTSGTTSDSKPVVYTQKYATHLAIRNANIFNHTEHSRVIHTRNMHHASSLMLHFLPTLYKCSLHWHKYVNVDSVENTDSFLDLLLDAKINFCLVDNRYNLDAMLGQIVRRQIHFPQSLELNISGFLLTSDLKDQIADHNITIVSTFGSVDTGVPLFINRLDQHTDADLMSGGLIGYFPSDGFYQLTIDHETVRVDCPTHWTEPRFLNDRIQEKNNLYYHLQRDNIITIGEVRFDLNQLTKFVQQLIYSFEVLIVVDQEQQALYLAVWNSDISIKLPDLVAALMDSEFKKCATLFKKIRHFDKKQFTIDTKVSVDQLRGYLQTNDSN